MATVDLKSINNKDVSVTARIEKIEAKVQARSNGRTVVSDENNVLVGQTTNKDVSVTLNDQSFSIQVLPDSIDKVVEVNPIKYETLQLVDWENPGQIGAETPNTAEFTNLSSGIIQAIALTLKPQYREATRDGSGNLLRVSYYTNSSKAAELLRKTFTYSSGSLATLTVTDYTRTPSVAYTTTYNRDGNGNLANWETA
jgi:hypothetical protein